MPKQRLTKVQKKAVEILTEHGKLNMSLTKKRVCSYRINLTLKLLLYRL
jgi:hypothetical protein